MDWKDYLKRLHCGYAMCSDNEVFQNLASGLQQMTPLVEIARVQTLAELLNAKPLVADFVMVCDHGTPELVEQIGQLSRKVNCPILVVLTPTPDQTIEHQVAVAARLLQEGAHRVWNHKSGGELPLTDLLLAIISAKKIEGRRSVDRKTVHDIRDLISQSIMCSALIKSEMANPESEIATLMGQQEQLLWDCSQMLEKI